MKNKIKEHKNIGGTLDGTLDGILLWYAKITFKPDTQPVLSLPQAKYNNIDSNSGNHTV